MLKILKCQKILKNQKIHYLEIIEAKQNVYITTQQRNIRKRWVTLKKKNMAIIVEIFPTISNITKKKNEPKNTYVKTSQRQKELRIKRFKTYKLQKQNKKICDYIVINSTKN